MDNAFPKNFHEYEDIVLECLGVDEETLRMLIDTFFESTTKDIETLSAFVNLSDFENIRLKAHEIKGASSSMRFDYLAKLLKSIEIAATSTKKEEVVTLYQRIKDEFQRVKIVVSFEEHK
jgi:HPt (histidine-containing phosphotransfer) domain-containing protein